MTRARDALASKLTAIAGGAAQSTASEPSHDVGEQLAGDGAAVHKPRFRLLTDVELERMPPITFLVDGVLPTAGLGAIYGAPAAGKSFLALDMACSVAAGASWLGRPTKQGPVVYVAAEGSAGLQQRLSAWKEYQGILGSSLPIYFLTEPANLLAPTDVVALLLAFAALPRQPALIIIDTLHRSMPGGDENSAKDVGLVIEHADQLRRQTGAAVLLVHHTAKGSELERGSSSLRGGVDALLYAKADDSGRELRCEKAKDWPAFDPVRYELHQVASSCVVLASEAGDSYGDQAITSQMRQALTTLSQAFLNRGATTTEWLKASEMSEATFYRARTQLVRGGYVVEPQEARGGRYRATDSGRSVLAINSHETITKLSHPPAMLAITLSEARRADSDDSKASVARSGQ